eukprot:505379_1
MSDSDWMEEEFCKTLVIDMGSYKTSSGFGGDDAPRSVISSSIGYLSHNKIQDKDKQTYFGEYEPFTIKQFDYKYDTNKLNIQPTTEYFPSINNILISAFIRNNFKKQLPNDITNLINKNIPRGMIINWENIQLLWQHIFSNELRILPDEYCILLSEPPINPKYNRNKMSEILFETFDSYGITFENTASLSLIPSGRNEGIVIDSGYYKTDITPIYGGYALKNNIIRLELGGYDVSNYLQMLIKDNKNISLSLDIVNDIKHKLVDVNLNDEMLQTDNIMRCVQIMNTNNNKSYKLPDGKCINIGKELFMSTEILFEPTLINKACINENGIHKLLCELINNCDIDLRPNLYNNVVLSGGNTMFDNLYWRLESEIFKINDVKGLNRIKIMSPTAERKYSAWIGGSILLQLSNTMWVYKHEYLEYGNTIIHRKCF